jgi:preprotein translocase subunit SecD
VTLTAAGLAGFILSIGMAVDANVLIFERTKEELKKGKSIQDALA